MLPVVSLFFKDFHMESKSRSKIFKADNYKNFDCINWLKSRFFKKNDFFMQTKGGNKKVTK